MRPYARIIIMDPSNNAWHRDYTIAAICKWFPDTIHLPFQAHDISFISESKNFKSHRSIKRKKENKNLFCVANKNDFLSDYEKPTTELIKECRNAKIFSSTEARCRTTGKSANWVTDWVKSKLLHEICNHSRGYVSWFFIKAFAVNNVSINLINNHLLKKKNIIDNKNTKSYFSIKCKNNDILVALNRNSKAITGDTLNTVEEENWIQRISCKIKSILPDLHAKIRSRSTTVLNLYYSENIFAVNESIPISEVISNRIFFASKDCDSKSSIRRKIEEFCIQRKKSFRKKADKDDICKKRERSCKTAEKKCQKKEKTCGKKEIDCSKRRKQTCEEQRKVSCKKRKGLDKDVRDCRKTREMKPQEEPSKEYKDCDTSKTKEDFCQRQRRVEQTQTSCAKSATIKQTEKDICKKSEEDEYQRSYDENDKCTKEKKRRKEEDEKASCKQKQKETCQEKKKTDYLFESGKSIELGKIRANRDPLSIISSHQQIMGIDFINDFQQDLNSTVDRHFSSPHEHFDSNFRRCDDRQFDESKPLYDKQLHDDYFPQGDEYEEEIGTGDHQLGKKSKKPPRSDDEYDNFKPIILMFENDKCVSGGPLTKLITHVHFPNTGLIETVQTILMSKRISDQEAVEKLQILIDKVTEFKRRAFRDKSNAAKSRGQSDERKEKKIGKKNNGAETTNRSGLTNQKQDYSFV
nr:PREDICTED: uncharacterized protein LOC105667358 [Linepithema humile]